MNSDAHLRNALSTNVSATYRMSAYRMDRWHAHCDGNRGKVIKLLLGHYPPPLNGATPAIQGVQDTIKRLHFDKNNGIIVCVIVLFAYGDLFQRISVRFKLHAYKCVVYVSGIVIFLICSLFLDVSFKKIFLTQNCIFLNILQVYQRAKSECSCMMQCV